MLRSKKYKVDSSIRERTSNQDKPIWDHKPKAEVADKFI